MSKTLTFPTTQRQAQVEINRRHRSFRRGIISDAHPMDVPQDGLYGSDNVDVYPGRCEVRPGYKRMSDEKLPGIGTGISASKSGTTITISAGYSPSSDNEGDYFSFPSGNDYLITSVSGSDLTVTDSTAESDTTTGKIRQEVNSEIWHPVHKKRVMHIGTRIYSSDWDITSWTRVYGLSTAPSNKKSRMKIFGDNVFLYNDNGVYIIEMGETVPTFQKLNNTMLESTITEVDESTTKKYGRRYTVTMSELSGNYLNDRWDGQTILHESSNFAVDSDGRDYSEIFTVKKIGPTADTYGILTGGTLNALRDTPGEWEAITDGQAKFTINSTTNEIFVDFTNCKTWADVAGRIQSALRDYWSTITFEYDTDHFVLTAPNASDTVGYCTAASGGTDIGGSTYLEMQSGQGTTDNTATVYANLELSYLQTPYTESGGTYTYLNEYTHYSLYATKDIGDNGIDPVTGKGNNSELYIHIADIPIITSFVVSTAGDGTVTASKGTFSNDMVGSTLYLSDGKSGEITAYTSSSVVTWDQTDVTTNLGATVGTDKAFVFSQSGTTVTASAGTPFASGDVGKRIFASDGTLIVIAGYTSSTVVTAADSATRTGLGGGILNGPVADATKNRRVYNDSTTDDVLSTRVNKYWLKNRFWSPVPNCDTGVFCNGFMICAVRGNRTIYETQLADDYLLGYYDPEFQTDVTQDAIQELRVYKDFVSAICSNSTVSWDTNITAEETRPDVGDAIIYLASKKVVDDQVGTQFHESICPVHEGVDILVTNDFEVRLFNGNDYGPSMSGKMSKNLRKLQTVGAASYDPIRGYFIWGTEGSLTTISSIDRLPFPDKCYRFSINEDQGVIGGVLYSGDDWIKPPNGIAGFKITDDNNKTRQCVLHNEDGRHYWINTYDGPSMTRTFIDKDDNAGNGTEISWSLTLGADVGRNLALKIRHELTRTVLAPYDTTNAGDSGYDADGFRSGLELDLNAYNSADWETSYAIANNFDKERDITFDEVPEDRGIQMKLSGNRSEVTILEIINTYSQFDNALEPSNREMSEADYQAGFNTPLLWLSRHSNKYLNLATGSAISGTPTAATGADSKTESGFQISAALDTIDVTLTAGSVLFWADGTVSLTIGGDAVALSSVGTHAGFTLYYATGIAKTGTLRLTPTGTRIIQDLRCYNSEIDSNERTYLYNDMVKNDGNNTMPLW